MKTFNVPDTMKNQNPLPFLFLCFTWLALPGSLQSQPDYASETDVANYVRQMLYWSDANPTNRSIAAFRYKDLLYTNDASGIRPDRQRIGAYYGDAERARALAAETVLRRGLTNNPASAVLGGLLLDIYYDRTAAEFVLAGNTLVSADKARMGPPSVPTGLIIDDEIGLYQQAVDACRSALMSHLALLRDNLGMASVPPAGYQLFQQLVPARVLDPANCLSNGVPVTATGSADALLSGYKDLVLLLNGLRDYGRAIVPLVRLKMTRNNANDVQEVRNLMTDGERFLFLQTSMLRGIFRDLDPVDTNTVAKSDVAHALAAVDQSISELEAVGLTIRSGGNLLGFESDFLMLVQKYAGQAEDVFDSFDALQLRLDPTDLSSPLRYATDLQAEARDSYDDYRGFQEQLEIQLGNLGGSAEDRLYQIVGALPGTPEYSQPENNVGSEIWQQIKSIEAARLRIYRNQTNMNNLNREIEIELWRASGVSNAAIWYGNEQASLTETIGRYSAEQAAANSLADAANPSAATTYLGIAAHVLDAAAQSIGEILKAKGEGMKEVLAGQEQADIEGVENTAKVETLLLGMNTLAVDSQEAAILLEQEVGRWTALLREKADLENTLAESKQDLAGRYFADPVHHLRYLHQTMLANLSFDEAQKWLFYMARALEYKWNTPFVNYFYLGRRWSTATLFKLRNADELQQFYQAMVSFNSLVQLPQDDYWDWFSVREDFFGYRMYDDTGTNLLYYVDPANPAVTNLTAIQAFRQTLRGLTNSLGTITLNFSTVREIPGGTFFRGPRFDTNLQTVLSAGLFLDKIKWIKINLPGSHSLGRSSLAGELTYGGSSFIRNFDVGHFVEGRPDRLADELTAYSTRYWFFHPPSARWRFSEALKSPVTMTLTNDSRMPPSVGEINIFKERSVATTGWVLSIPTQDLGVPVLKINELNDVELYFYHYAVSREIPEGAAATSATDGTTTARRTIPFPYYLKYEPND